jgi:hypothetical protein
VSNVIIVMAAKVMLTDLRENRQNWKIELDWEFELSVKERLLSNITAIKTKDKCPYQLFLGCRLKLLA